MSKWSHLYSTDEPAIIKYNQFQKLYISILFLCDGNDVDAYVDNSVNVRCGMRK